MSKLTGARYIAEFFKAYGVTHYFFMPVSIHRAIKEMGRLDVMAVAAHSEKAAAYMADGYARVSGRVGVCGAQTIGATNLAAGLRDAVMARIPLVALTGGKYADTRYKLSYQEIDDMPIFEALTKFNAVVDDPSRLPDLLRTAFRAATTGVPKPVHLELSGSGLLGPGFGAAPVAGVDVGGGVVRGGCAQDAQAEAGLDADDRSGGSDGPLLVGAPVARLDVNAGVVGG